MFGHLRIEKESKSVSNNSNLMCFKYSTLEKATNNFNESCKLGVGGYGEVFKVMYVVFLLYSIYKFFYHCLLKEDFMSL